MFSDILSITAYLLYTYAANAKTHILSDKTNLLESRFGGCMNRVWGLSVAAPNSNASLSIFLGKHNALSF